MIGEPYLTEDRLEDFRTEADLEAIYADEAQARAEHIKVAIDECVTGRTTVPAAIAKLADLDAIDVIVVGGRNARRALTRTERMAWATTAIRDAFIDTVLSVEDGQALTELS